MKSQPSSIQVEIENIVATTTIDQELDVAQLGADLPSGTYDAEQFPGVICRLPTVSATMLLYRTGTITSTGANSVQDVEHGYRELFTQLRDLGIPVTEEPSISIENLVSSADLETSLNLNALAIGLGIEDIEYEPEQFPGLVYRLEETSLVVLLFNSGKLIITGAKTKAQAQMGAKRVKSRLSELGVLNA
ncbi:TATA-box-binding protein [Haladaptatus sp. W1]|uniref:TATA-box-binding protein n=1 Tax=Haladaptatus sp. W1 TaxID=1897478 RepID=UPI000849AF41|nr:TATA-box-binding protein [Haladaptatus sp. W1]ODR79197.1 TATA-box-binding protein [Haladaptatus sp. W1]